MTASPESPLRKIIFIQRIARFATSSPKQLLKLCYVNDQEFRTTILAYSFELLLKPLLSFEFHDSNDNIARTWFLNFKQLHAFDQSCAETEETTPLSLRDSTWGLNRRLSMKSTVVRPFFDACENVHYSSNGQYKHSEHGIIFRTFFNKIVHMKWNKFRRALSFVFRNVSKENMDIIVAFKDFIDKIINHLAHLHHSQSRESADSTIFDLHETNDRTQCVHRLQFPIELFVEEVLAGSQWQMVYWILENHRNPRLLEFFFPVARHDALLTLHPRAGEQEDSSCCSRLFWQLPIKTEYFFRCHIKQQQEVDDDYEGDRTVNLSRAKDFVFYYCMDVTRKFAAAAARSGRLDILKSICESDPRFLPVNVVKLNDPAFVFEDIKYVTGAISWTSLQLALAHAQKFNREDIIIYLLENPFKRKFDPNVLAPIIDEHDSEEWSSVRRNLAAKQGTLTMNEIYRLLSVRKNKFRNLQTNVIVTTMRRAVERDQAQVVRYFIDPFSECYSSTSSNSNNDSSMNNNNNNNIETIFTPTSHFCQHALKMQHWFARTGLSKFYQRINFPPPFRGGSIFLNSIEFKSIKVFNFLIEFALKNHQQQHETISSVTSSSSSAADPTITTHHHLYLHPGEGKRQKRRPYENPLLYCTHAGSISDCTRKNRSRPTQTLERVYDISFEMAKKILLVASKHPEIFSVDCVSQLLNDIALSPSHRWTALHGAIFRNRCDLIRLFSFFGADHSLVHSKTFLPRATPYFFMMLLVDDPEDLKEPYRHGLMKNAAVFYKERVLDKIDQMQKIKESQGLALGKFDDLDAEIEDLMKLRFDEKEIPVDIHDKLFGSLSGYRMNFSKFDYLTRRYRVR